MSNLILSPFTVGDLSFTNLSVNEVDLGSVAAFTQFPGTDQGIKTGNNTGIAWGGVNAGVYGANSSEVVNLNYSVSTISGSSLISTISQLYTADVFSGPGIHLTAVENIYSTSGVLLGTQTYTQGVVNLAFTTLYSAQQSINVQVTLTLAVDGTGNSTSEVLISALQQSYGVIPASQNTASIGDIVFLDTTGTGLESGFDTGQGVAGVTVELLNGTGTTVLETTITDAAGRYKFINLAAGVYEVKFLPLAGYTLTTQGAGGNPALNSSANQSTGITAPITLAAGEANHNVEAGLQVKPAPASLGDYVWLDLNRNGLQDASDPGVAGVTVQLLSADTLTLKISEDAYQGDAQYTVSVNGVQIGGTRVATASHAAGADNIVTLTGNFGTNPAVVVTFLNDAYAGTSSTDRNLYVDGITYNGTSQAASAALYSAGGHSFGLTGSGGLVLATTTTDSTGHYAFNNLNAGVYEVKFIAPTGDAFVTQNVGTNTQIDSNASQGSGVTAPITLVAGQNNMTIDAGLQQASGISVLKQPCSVVVNQCGQVTYSFSVTNTGTTALTNVKITDNIGSAAHPDIVTPTAVMSCNYNVGDTNHNGLLDAGETWKFTETVSQITCTTGAAGAVCHVATGSNLSAGCTAWLHSSFNPTSCADGASYKFQGVSCSISGSGVGAKPITIGCADAEVTFSRNCSQATTVYDTAKNCWVTTLPANCNPGSVFLTGTPLTIPSGCNLTNASVTWSVGDASNNCGTSHLTWDGGCTGYQSFNKNGCNGTADLNQIGVKACDNGSGYGNGGSCDIGYGYNNGNYCDLGYTATGGGCGGNGWYSTWNSHGWQGCGSDDAGTPENQYVSSNCGDVSSCAGYTQCYGGYTNYYGCGSSYYGNSCGGTGSVGQNNTPSIAGAADTVTVTAQAVTATSCATTTASGSHLTSGCTAWLHSTFKPTSCADGSTYSFKGVSCTIAGTGSPITVKCPDSTVTFSKSCTTATTVFNAATNCWTTTLPADTNPGNIFLTGCPKTVDAGCDLTGAKITWSIGGSSNNCGASNLNWTGGCTGYSSFNQNTCNGGADYNQIGVKSCDNLTSNNDSSDCAGTPTKQYNSTNCGDSTACTNTDNDTNTCGTTCTVTSTGATVTATDTKEVQVLGCSSNVSVNGTATTASLSATYGAAQTLEFSYNPGNIVSLQQVQAGLATVTGSNSSSLAFMEITNSANPYASGAAIYFQGEVTTGEKIFADATTNVLTNTAIAGGHFSGTAGADIYAYVFSSQQAFQSGATPMQTMAYNTSGSQAMHIGDTIGSLSVIGYVGANGGHLAS